MISETTVNTVKNLPVVDIIQRTVSTPLKRQGTNWFMLSPFKEEKTPSFCIWPHSNTWKCFTSGKQGDGIDFIREYQHLSFSEAIEHIANLFHIPVEYTDGDRSKRASQHSLRNAIFAINDLALNFFREHFRNDTEQAQIVRDYWTQERGFTADLADEFSIGFAPSNDNKALARIICQKFDGAAIFESGMFYGRKGGSFSNPDDLTLRWSGRLMIPIHDSQGRVCGFSGRKVTGITDRTVAGEQGKYINTPETPVFKKGELLFNLHRAHKEAHRGERFNLVEGPLDVLRLWQNGFKTTVAPQGTAITEEQLKLLSRYQNGFRAVFDGDEAGARAALRCIPLAYKTEANVVFIMLPSGHDPDSIMLGLPGTQARERFAALLKQEYSPNQFAIKLLLNGEPPKTAQERANTLRTILGWIEQCPSDLTVWCQIEEVAKLLSMPSQPLWSEFAHLYNIALPPPKPTHASMPAKQALACAG